uniref:Uncharacterized protein n=1 Tax=Glossina palpalis gambiensis TaxID=67801 RepID=A0A1B0AP06_9MUSC
MNGFYAISSYHFVIAIASLVSNLLISLPRLEVYIRERPNKEINGFTNFINIWRLIRSMFSRNLTSVNEIKAFGVISSNLISSNLCIEFEVSIYRGLCSKETRIVSQPKRKEDCNLHVSRYLNPINTVAYEEHKVNHTTSDNY